MIAVSAVSEIMSSEDTVTITSESGNTARDVAEVMVKKGISSVIVIDKKTKPIGIITEKDLVRRVCLKNMSASRFAVEEIMSSPLITIMAYDSVDTASRIMTHNQIKHLVVLEEDNRICGLLSVTDITKHLAEILLNDYNRYRSLRSLIDMTTTSSAARDDREKK
ncbi:MAG: CBS domain-containing protein [Nitrososphaeraceae archaeon]|jgi:signal-transduction protein with cAMP-binding, CBS, and nucleotidyltransferase domain